MRSPTWRMATLSPTRKRTCRWPTLAPRRYAYQHTNTPFPSAGMSPRRTELEQLEVHFTPAKGGGNTTTATLPARSPNANPSQRANRSPHANQATDQPLNAAAANQRSPIIHCTNPLSNLSIPFQPLPIPIQFILGVPLDQAVHQLLPQCSVWHRSQMQRV